MHRKDPIFWGAAAIFVLSLVIAAITQNQLWCFLMAGSYLLRPTLASLGVARRFVDERQMSIQYRSGNIAFAVMIIASIGMAVYQNSKGDHTWELFNIVVVVGLAAKALANVLLVKNYREAGSRIIMAVGLLAVLFVAVENGPTLGGLMEASPWLLIVGIGLLSRKYPRVIGTLLFVVAAAFLSFVLWRSESAAPIVTGSLICMLLVLAGLCLFAREKSETDSESVPAPRAQQ